MNSTELKLDYKLCKPSSAGIPAIIVAAGESTRMSGTNKQLALLGGIPVLARTLLAFERCRSVSNIILVVRDEDIFEIQMMAEKYMIGKISDIICGGKTRQKSVLKGLSRLSENTQKVLIHDGARPIVSDSIINAVALALREYSAVTCAVRVKDTIKEIDPKGKVIKTLSRDSLVAVQTPQGVRVKDYLQAIDIVSDVDSFTDDMSIMEAAGYEVITVEGSYRNIKITTPEDIWIAESFVRGEEER